MAPSSDLLKAISLLCSGILTAWNGAFVQQDRRTSDPWQRWFLDPSFDAEVDEDTLLTTQMKEQIAKLLIALKNFANFNKWLRAFEMISSKKHQFSGDEFSPQLVTFCRHHFSWQQTRILQCEGSSDFLGVFCVKSMLMLNNKQAWAVVRLWENLNGYDRYNICPFPNPAVVALMLRRWHFLKLIWNLFFKKYFK